MPTHADSLARLHVKVVPRASRSQIVGWLGERLKIKIAAPPQDGRANAALAAFLAETLSVPKSHVRVSAGHASSSKVVEIDGLAQAELVGRLEALLR
jgi:uncharacterized protein